MFERSPDYFRQFRKNFCFFLFKEKPKAGLDFPLDVVISIGLHSPVHGELCNALPDNHYHVLSQCFGENYKGQPKSYLLPCLYSTYALLIAISDEKEICDEIFEKLDHAIQYSCDPPNRNQKKLLLSICFSVQKCDKAVQVSSGLSQGTIQRLENVMLGPYTGHFLIIADIFKLVMDRSILCLY